MIATGNFMQLGVAQAGQQIADLSGGAERIARALNEQHGFEHVPEVRVAQAVGTSRRMERIAEKYEAGNRRMLSGGRLRCDPAAHRFAADEYRQLLAHLLARGRDGVHPMGFENRRRIGNLAARDHVWEIERNRREAALDHAVREPGDERARLPGTGAVSEDESGRRTRAGVDCDVNPVAHGRIMARARDLLEETLEAWAYTRSGVIDELENIPDDQFKFKPTPASRSVAELAQHIIESALMATGELNRPDGSFRRKSYAGFIEEYAGTRAHTVKKGELMALLRATHDEALSAFGNTGQAGLLREIVQFNGEPATRLTWLNHAIGHEEYHRGQLALYARLMGRVPALTQLINSSETAEP